MNSISQQKELKETSIKDLISQYTRYWYFFILAVIIALSCAFLYLRYAERIYQTTSTIIIKDEKKGGGAELAAFSELSYFQNAFSSNISSELVLLKSKSLIAKAVKELDLNVRYFYSGNIKTSELYGYKPIKVNYLTVSDTLQSALPILFITPQSNTSYSISIGENNVAKTYDYGVIASFSFGDITVLPSSSNPEKFEEYIGRKIEVRYAPLSLAAATFQGGLELGHDGKSGEVVTLNMKSTIPQRSEDFLNELVYQYNQDAINDRSQVSQKTSKFIDSRLEIITRELDSVEKNKEDFKSSNRLTDISAEAQLVLENASQFDRRQVDVATQLELVNSMVDYIDQSDQTELLPSNMGIGGEGVVTSVDTYNQLVLERNKMLQSSTEQNPVVQNLNIQIEQLKSSISQSLKSQQQNFKTSLRDLNFQENKLNSKLSRVPTQEKLFRGIVRQQNIKEQLYLFLLQQREETNISLAVTSSKAKVVDTAFSGRSPVAPKKSIIYLMSFIVGLLIPFLLIYVYYLLNTKITNRRDVERVHTNTPLIGEVPKLGRNDEELIQASDHSILAESFRILRTNLQYLLINKENSTQNKKRIFVTSTIKGEGKTFVAFNLALTLALTGKKVVLIGADIRNPQLHRYLPPEYKNKAGLTEYIVDENLTVQDLIVKSEHEKNLSLVMSGVIPPNPAELLMQPRVENFFENINEHFDYVIVDTAPSMLVTDTILLNRLADLTLYVIRANYTDKKLLEFSHDAIADGRLSNVAFILNNVTLANFGYGNKYGYTYSAEKKTFWQRLFNK
ncbi:tyrosine protein kinase [Patiriisocius marinistellae]|uniref:non-specific protein-tyrosine kinase n=1 Tax=Patiriisocius marinistellae TaxID=2494560 RepID=A0A5J4FYQ5_9FLAO|nr:polysaccharide biosynthesis tyrosine autokinase [Patiriisocius marinistellae]GEQ87193.1 tyrosine protein kinase [Patiriisocius marinistellae]